MKAPTQFLKLSKGNVAYDEIGSGPLVLCSPGLGDLRSQFRFLAPKLAAAGYRVVTMDLRGLGESSASFDKYDGQAVGEDMIALIRHLNAGPAVIVGNSLSGGASVFAAAEAPELVAGLVPVCPFTRGPNMNAAVIALMRCLLASQTLRNNAWFAAYPSFYRTKPADYDAHLAKMKANVREPGRSAALGQLMLSRHDYSEARFDKVKAPVLIVMGANDGDFSKPEVEAAEVAKALSGKYVMINNAAHYAHIDSADAVAEAIIPFLASVTKPVRK
jgi:pimeloyl-ACP methyl ester carboxylesterase